MRAIVAPPGSGAASWLAAALLWIRRRRAASRSPDNPQALVRLAGQALTPRVSVHALRWGSEEILLACTDGNAVLVARRSAQRTAGVQE